jgi:hypothetical protein
MSWCSSSSGSVAQPTYRYNPLNEPSREFDEFVIPKIMPINVGNALLDSLQTAPSCNNGPKGGNRPHKTKQTKRRNHKTTNKKKRRRRTTNKKRNNYKSR